MTLKLELNLPDALVRKAKRAGLLEQEAFAQMLERELTRQKSSSRFWSALDNLSASPLPPMTSAEVNAEIKTYRHQKRQPRENRR
jgi:hypothetical protein